MVAATLGAQTRAVKQHMVEGTVLDAGNKPVPNAVVYLENVNSLNVYSYLSDPKGYYHFDHVIPQTDYEVWAFKDGIESKHQWISKFSSHKKFEFTLELNPKTKKFLGIF